jgi:transposase
MSKAYTSKTKVDIVLESIKKDNVVQVAREHGISHGMLSNWKKQFTDNAQAIFESTTDKEVVNLNNKIKDLERMLGKKEVELNLLKNFSDFYQSKNTT